MRNWRLHLALGLLLAGVAAFVFLPLRDWLLELVARAQTLGPGGAFLFMALFVPACVLCLPGTPITLFCGYAYGFWPTLPAAILMSNLGAAAAFSVSRFLLSASIQRGLARRPRLAAAHRAVGEKSLRLVFLLRLTPAIPFNGLNYALGVTPIRFGHYALATFLGMLPGTTLNTYTAALFGELGRSLDDPTPMGMPEKVFLGVRLAAALAVTLLVARTTRRILAGDGTVPGTDPPDSCQPSA